MKKYLWRLVLFFKDEQIQTEFISKCPAVGDTITRNGFAEVATPLLDFYFGDVFYAVPNSPVGREAIATPSGSTANIVFISDDPSKRRTGAALKRPYKSLLRTEVFNVQNAAGEIRNSVQIQRERTYK